MPHTPIQPYKAGEPLGRAAINEIINGVVHRITNGRGIVIKRGGRQIIIELAEPFPYSRKGKGGITMVKVLGEYTDAEGVTKNGYESPYAGIEIDKDGNEIGARIEDIYDKESTADFAENDIIWVFEDGAGNNVVIPTFLRENTVT